MDSHDSRPSSSRRSQPSVVNQEFTEKHSEDHVEIDSQGIQRSGEMNNLNNNEPNSHNAREDIALINASLAGLTLKEDDDKSVTLKKSTNDGIIRESNSNLNLPAGIIQKESGLLCEYCNDVKISSYHNAIEHAYSKKHLKRHEIFQKGICWIENTSYQCTSCKCIIETLDGVIKHLETDQHRNMIGVNADEKKSLLKEKSSASTQSSIGASTSWLSLAVASTRKRSNGGSTKKEAEQRIQQPRTESEVAAVLEHGKPATAAAPASVITQPGISNKHINTSKKNTVTAVKMYGLTEKCMKLCHSDKNLPDGIETISDQSFFLCTICNCRVSNSLKNVKNHVEGNIHRTSGKKFILKVRETTFACFICFNIMYNPKSLQKHLNSENHQQKFKTRQSQIKPNSVPSPAATVTELLTPIKESGESKYFCSICNVQIQGDALVPLEHTLSYRHQSILRNESTSGKSLSTASEIPFSTVIQPLMSIQVTKVSRTNTVTSLKKYGLAEKCMELCHSDTSLPDGIKTISDQSFLVCLVCNCKISSLKNVEEHVKGNSHKISAKKKILNSKKTTIASLTELFKPIEQHGGQKYTCSTCNGQMQGDILVPLEHTLQSGHQSILASELSSKMSFSSARIATPPSTIAEPLSLHQHSNTSKKNTPAIVKNNGLAEKCLQLCHSDKNLPNGIATISDQPFLICTICHCAISSLKNVEEHVKSASHKTSAKSNILNAKKTTFACLTKLFKPIEQHGEKKYTCSICNIQIQGDILVPLEHTLGPRHQSILVSQSSSEMSLSSARVITPSSTAAQPLSSHQYVNTSKKNTPIIVKKDSLAAKCLQLCHSDTSLPDGIKTISDQSYLVCTICNCKISCLKNVDEHVKGNAHKTSAKNNILNTKKTTFACLIELFKPIEQHGEKKYTCSICNIQIQGDILVLLEHTLGPKHQSILVSQSSSKMSLSSVRIATPFSTIAHPLSANQQVDTSKKDAANTVRKNELAEKCIDLCHSNKHLPDGIETILDQPFFICTICNCKVSSNLKTVEEHVKGTIHRKNGTKFILKIRETTFACFICSIIIGNPQSLEEHLGSDNHRQLKTKQSQLKSKRTSNPLATVTALLKPIKELERNKYSCSICNVQIHGNVLTPLEHTLGQKHQSMLKMTSSLEKSVQEVPLASNMQGNISKKNTSTTTTNENTPKHSESSSSVIQKTSTKPRTKRTKRSTKKFKMTDKKKLICPFCAKETEFVYIFHAHLTSHLWQRFFNNSALKIGENCKIIQEVYGDIENEDQYIPTTQEELSEDSGHLEFTCILGKSPRKAPSQNSRQRPLDFDIDDGVDIYGINKQKKEDFQLGVLLTFAIDQENLYCLVCRKTIKKSVQVFYEHLCSVKHMDYLQQMIEDHRKFKDYPGELSDLALAYEYMEETSDCQVKCHACGITLPNDIVSLRKHSKDDGHTTRCAAFVDKAKTSFSALSSRMYGDFYSVKTYWCVPCKTRFSVEIEFRRHLYGKKHLKKIQRFKDMDEELIFDYCAICTALWYGFLKTFSYHSRCPMHKHYVGQSFILTGRLPISAERLLSSADQNISQLLKRIDNLQMENVEKESILIHDLEKHAREKYPSCVAHPFGSRVTKLGGTNSDLDMFLDCSTRKYPVYAGRHSSVEQVEKRLTVIQSCLEKKRKVWLVDRAILDARTPIIKTVHLPTRIECDISFTNGLTVEGTKLIKSYCEKFPNCRGMIVFVKNWMGHCELTGLNGIHSCATAWMVIFFLQLKGILPSVAELIAKKKQSRLIGGWETGVDLEFEVIDIGEPIGRLLAGFFAFYAGFDYRNEVICPLLGRSVKKTDFQKRTLLPDEMKLYLHYLESEINPEPFRIDSILCVHDPFDLSQNITKAVKKSMVYQLKSFCSLSAQILERY